MRSRMVVGLAVVLLAGCGSSETVLFDEEFALLLDGRRLEIKVSPGKQNQKHKIVATASEPINVYVYMVGDAEVVRKELPHVTARVLAHKRETDKAELEVSLPPDSVAEVYITRAAGKPTNVKMKITIKK